MSLDSSTTHHTSQGATDIHNRTGRLYIQENEDKVEHSLDEDYYEDDYQEPQNYQEISGDFTN